MRSSSLSRAPNRSPLQVAHAPALAPYETVHVVVRGTTRLAAGRFLRARGTTDVPFDVAVANTAHELWTANDHRLALVDVHQATVLRSFPLPVGLLRAIAVAPSGKDVYVSVTATSARTEALVVSRLDGRTGAILARTSIPMVAAGSLTAVTTTGVWLSVRYGMNGTSMLLDARTRAIKTPPRTLAPGDPTPSPRADLTMGFAATAVGGTIGLTWTTGIACARETTGAVLAAAYSPRATDGSYRWAIPFASFGHRLFAAVPPDSGLAPGDVRCLSPPAAC